MPNHHEPTTNSVYDNLSELYYDRYRRSAKSVVISWFGPADWRHHLRMVAAVGATAQKTEQGGMRCQTHADGPTDGNRGDGTPTIGVRGRTK